jgi:protein involved in polysaccharide export with SLBB domain
MTLTWRWFALLGCAASVVWSCGSGQPPVTPIPEDINMPMDTTMGPQDVFDIRVFGEKELSSTFRVASDGTIDYPLLGTIKVEGMTPTEVADTVEKGLVEREFIKKPQVSVFVKEYNSKKVSVFGQVKKTGMYPYEDGMTVVEALSVAGGFTSMAKKNDTVVIRIIGGEKKRFRVPVEAIGQGRASNFTLRPGDIVFVPERII